MSGRAHREVDRFLSFSESDQVKVCRIVVQNNREVSDAVAAKTGVRHESPQVLLIRDGLCHWNASHRAITAELLKEAVKFII